MIDLTAAGTDINTFRHYFDFGCSFADVAGLIIKPG